MCTSITLRHHPHPPPDILHAASMSSWTNRNKQGGTHTSDYPALLDRNMQPTCIAVRKAIHYRANQSPCIMTQSSASQPPFFTCLGKLTPEDNRLALKPFPLPLPDPINCTLIITVCNSDVHVTLDGLSAPEGFDIRAFRFRVMQLAQHFADTALSAISFAEGGNYSVRLSSIWDNTLIESEEDPRLKFSHDPASLTIENHNEVSGHIVRMSFENLAFRLAIADYSAALKLSNLQYNTPFLCYRALESLRQHFDGCWNKMHESLGTDPCVIKTLIQQHANKARHGSPPELQTWNNNSTWRALAYVRDTLLAFLIKNSTAEIEMPVLDLTRIPCDIEPQHRKDCTHK